MMKYMTLDETYYKNGERTQYIEMAALFIAGFMISFLAGAPQVLVGTLVNAFLIRSALSLSGKKALPVVMAPSLGAVAKGMLLGPATPYLALMMPFIWVGNLLLVCAFKAYVKNKRNYPVFLLSGAAAKTMLLFGTATVLYSLSAVPATLIGAMGLMQLLTAMLGGLLVYGGMKMEGSI